MSPSPPPDELAALLAAAILDGLRAYEREVLAPRGLDPAGQVPPAELQALREAVARRIALCWRDFRPS